jgi:hypothetical protein
MRAYFGLAAAVVLALASLAQATPLDVKQVSADMKWAAHLDVDGLIASGLVKKAREEILKAHPEIESHLTMLRNLWRFDPLKDLHAVTVYGTQLKKDTGVAIIHANVDQKMLLEMVKTTPDHQVTTYGKFELHTWLKDGTKRENATFFKPDVIVFGASLDELKAALDVLDGTKPGLSIDSNELNGLVPPGTIFVAGAKDIDTAELPRESALIKKAESFLLVVGEKEGQVTVRATLNVKEAEIAKQIKTIIDGALALGTLVKSDDPDALKIIGGVKTTLADKTVTVEAQAPVDLLWTHIQKEVAKKIAEHQHHANSGE